MSAFKFSCLWLLFAVFYFIFSWLIFLVFPEVWLHDLLTDHGQNFIDEGEWDSISMSMILLLTLVVNLVFIFCSLAITQRLHKSIVRGFQHNRWVWMSAFKFSSLWLLFAATYCVFYVPIFSFFPKRWLCYLLGEDYEQLVIEGKWNAIFMPAVWLTTLVVNLVFIFLSLSLTQRLRNRRKLYTDERT